MRWPRPRTASFRPALFVVLSAAALPAFAAPNTTAAERLPTSIVPPPPGPTIEMHVKGGSLDDALLQLAHDTRTNVIADATPYAADTPAEATDYYEQAEHVTLSFARRERLSWFRHQDGTYLFWQMPDIVAIANRIVQGEGKPSLRDFRGPRTDRPFYATPLLASALSSNFNGTLGRLTGRTVPIGHLPDDVRLAMIDRAEKAGLTTVRAASLPFRDGYFNQVRVQLVDTTTRRVVHRGTEAVLVTIPTRELRVFDGDKNTYTVVRSEQE